MYNATDFIAGQRNYRSTVYGDKPLKDAYHILVFKILSQGLARVSDFFTIHRGYMNM